MTNKTDFETVIGLEVHAQLKTKTKMFCGCANETNPNKPNKNVCPLCMGHPGTLPVPNEQAIAWTRLAGLALNCDIVRFAKFDRKNYFYPDLPKGYQISQFDQPFCLNGRFDFIIGDEVRTVHLTRIHLEEDAGKLSHPEAADYSLVDYNRAGTPLMEIVTEPDIHSPAEARAFLQGLRQLLRYLGVSDADMEKGQMRADANISVRTKDSKRTTAIVEIKNMNSFRSVERALAFEEERLLEAMENEAEGETVKETRGWDEKSGTTLSQRSKEEAHDYRYFPEPDIPPVTVDEAELTKLKKDLPELPGEKQARFKKEYKLGLGDIAVLTDSPAMADFYEQIVSELQEWLKSDDVKLKKPEDAFKLAASYVVNELVKHLNETDASIADLKFTAENFAEFIAIVAQGKINSSAAQQVLKLMYETGQDPSQIIEEQNLAQVSDEGELEVIAENIVARNKAAVADYKKGKEASLQFLVGQMMKETKGKANPQVAAKLIKEKIG